MSSQLNEIKKIPDQQRSHLKGAGADDTYVVDQLLRDAGFEITDEHNGKFATVFFLKNKDYVIKVFGAHDKGYLAWYNFCRNNQSNPWVPKVRGNIIKISNDLYVVRLEKLTPSKLTAWDREGMRKVVYVAPYLTGEEQTNISHVLRDISDAKEMFPHLVSDPDFMKCAVFIRRGMKQGWLTDLHKENVLARGDQPVIIDPLASR